MGLGPIVKHFGCRKSKKLNTESLGIVYLNPFSLRPTLGAKGAILLTCNPNLTLLRGVVTLTLLFKGLGTKSKYFSRSETLILPNFLTKKLETKKETLVPVIWDLVT